MKYLLLLCIIHLLQWNISNACSCGKKFDQHDKRPFFIQYADPETNSQIDEKKSSIDNPSLSDKKSVKKIVIKNE